MHGTGAFNAMWNLVLAGSVVTLVGRHFDPVELLDTIQRERVNSISIVGDAFAKPILARARRRARSLGHLVAAGHRLQRRDLGGRDQGRPAAPQRPADHDRQPRQQRGHRHGHEHHHRRRAAGAHREVPLGPEHQGAHRGRPRGAARHAASAAASRSAAARRSATTRTRRSRRPRSWCIDGVRWSIPGDWAEVEADGTLKLLRPRQPVHQHRRREGVPGGGRGGAQAAPVGRRRGRRRRARRPLRRGDHRARRAARRRHRRRGRRSSPTCKAHLAALQGTQAGARRSTRSAAPRTASSTTRRSRPRPPPERPPDRQGCPAPTSPPPRRSGPRTLPRRRTR